MPWNGYNFEDSILISEKVVEDDRYTSIHIEELSVVARDTKLGAEEITRDISNLAENQLARLDESGIVYIGAEVASRRHAGRQGDAEGRNPADAGRKAAARDLRRKSVRREGHLAARAVRHGRHRDRRAGVHPRRHPARQARPADHRRRAQALSPGPERPAAYRRRRCLPASGKDADRQSRQRRSEEAGQGQQDHQGIPGRSRQIPLVRHPSGR